MINTEITTTICKQVFSVINNRVTATAAGRPIIRRAVDEYVILYILTVRIRDFFVSSRKAIVDWKLLTALCRIEVGHVIVLHRRMEFALQILTKRETKWSWIGATKAQSNNQVLNKPQRILTSCIHFNRSVFLKRRRDAWYIRSFPWKKNWRFLCLDYGLWLYIVGYMLSDHLWVQYVPLP